MSDMQDEAREVCAHPTLYTSTHLSRVPWEPCLLCERARLLSDLEAATKRAEAAEVNASRYEWLRERAEENGERIAPTQYDAMVDAERQVDP